MEKKKKGLTIKRNKTWSSAEETVEDVQHHHKSIVCFNSSGGQGDRKKQTTSSNLICRRWLSGVLALICTPILSLRARGMRIFYVPMVAPYFGILIVFVTHLVRSIWNESKGCEAFVDHGYNRTGMLLRRFIFFMILSV